MGAQISTVKKAQSAAAYLRFVSGSILLLSIFGSVFLVGYGLVPVCPIVDPGCSVWDKELYNLPTYLSLGVAQLLAVWLVHSLANSSAAGLELSARQFSSLYPEASAKEVRLNASDSRKIQYLTEDQLEEWILKGNPSLRNWSPKENFDEWISSQP